ncbi:MAG: hypothetical protein DHS20C18_24090 [Saprospiraceae bacterium]|nr:MAG: hypothetical protein DHS20C18_24090 [Saprospiraceae bacterium]
MAWKQKPFRPSTKLLNANSFGHWFVRYYPKRVIFLTNVASDLKLGRKMGRGGDNYCLLRPKKLKAGALSTPAIF